MKNAKKGLEVAMLVVLFSPLLGFAQTKVEEHWSRNNYPREIPEGVKVHIVAKGDTLWAIAATYLKDPYLWPQVFAQNNYISDPNLIYPGDPIRLDVGTVVTDEAISQSVEDDGPAPVADSASGGEAGEFEDMNAVAGDEGDQSQEDLGNVSEVTDFGGDSSEFVILPAGEREEMECSTIIYPLKNRKDTLKLSATVTGSEKVNVNDFAFDDVVYVDQGLDGGLEPGKEYTVVRGLELVSSPDGRFLGMALDQVGRIKLISVQPNSAIAAIQPSCYELQVGDKIMPYEQEPIPLITELPPLDRYGVINTKGFGFVIRTEDNLLSVGKGSLVTLDMGIDKNIAPGDIFIIYRDNPSSNPKKNIHLPEIFLGHAVALKTGANTCLAKIIDTINEVNVGDKIVPMVHMNGSE